MTAKHTILANWKMSQSNPKEALNLFTNLKNTVARLRSVSIILSPPVIFLQSLSSTYGGNKIAFSGQAISQSEEPSQTGATSAEQLANTGASYCIIGHSGCNDTLSDIRVKTFLALKYKLTPIVFIGESERDDHGKYLEQIREQINSALQELSTAQRGSVVFCYESILSVSSGEALDTYDIHTMALYIRKVLTEEYGANIARKTQILYGGSVNSENVASILEIAEVDGVAVGKVSTDVAEFTELLKIANKV